MKITFSIIVFVGLCMAFLGFQGLLSFAHAIQSKTDVTVVRVGIDKLPKYSRTIIWVLEPNNMDTLIFTQNTPAKVGEIVSVWNEAEMWITPLWLRDEQEKLPSREVFTGWFRHDAGLGLFFFLLGAFIMVVGILSILAPKK